VLLLGLMLAVNLPYQFKVIVSSNVGVEARATQSLNLGELLRSIESVF
jgi:hypothetical protein